jgi:arylsulfatase A-like enzyme
MAERPNIIVITSDTFRPDHIGANGKGFAETPELDDFLAKGYTFDKATVASFPTIPMRTDCITGQYTFTRHGWIPLKPEYVTLPDVLADSGYTTQLIADTAHMIGARFYEPFQHYHFRRGHEMDIPFSRLNQPVEMLVTDRRKVRVDREGEAHPVQAEIQPHTNFRSHYEDEAHCSVLADDVCHWIEDNHKGGPFFLWTDFFDVHEPWWPPEYLLGKYQPGYDGEPMAQPNYREADVYSADELRNMQARYAAMCTLLSKSVGRIFRMIEDTGLSENTIVVFMSDHGTQLGEHNRTGKTHIVPGLHDTCPFHPEITKICWTMHMPESMRSSVEPGARFDHLAQPPDLMPTLLDLCGVKPPDDLLIEGKSLAPIMRGEDDEGPRDLAITTTTGELKARRPAVTDGEWTLILSEPPDPAPPLLYHTVDDPAHANEVFSEHPDVARRLHSEMIEFLEAHGAGPELLDRHTAEKDGVA